MRRLLLFDIDGTLLHVDGAGRAALGAAMRQVCAETGPIDRLEFRGKTDPAIVRELLRGCGWPDARIDDCLPAIWERYVPALERELEARRAGGRICAGVEALLERLHADPGVVCALVTGNVEGGAWGKLKAWGLDRRFAFGAFGSDSENRDELPPIAVRRAESRHGRRLDLREVVVIGDTPADIQCARAAGVRCVAVASGGLGPEALREHSPDHVFESLADTEAVLEVLRDG